MHTYRLLSENSFKTCTPGPWHSPKHIHTYSQFMEVCHGPIAENTSTVMDYSFTSPEPDPQRLHCHAAATSCVLNNKQAAALINSKHMQLINVIAPS